MSPSPKPPFRRNLMTPPTLQAVPDGATRSDDGNWWWDESQWVAVTVAIPCNGCGGGVVVPAPESAYSCSGCGGSFFIRACPYCAKVVHARTSLAGRKVKCPACHRQFAWAKLRIVAAGETASKDVELQSRIADPDHRAVNGVAVAVSGFPPITQGMGCRLDFGKEGISVMALVVGGSYKSVAWLPYPEARLLRIAGRGALTTTRGGGWMGGGFGVGGLIEGALLAGALNAATRRTSSPIETFVHLNAGAKELMMLNSTITPDVLRSFLMGGGSGLAQQEVRPRWDVLEGRYPVRGRSAYRVWVAASAATRLRT